MALELGLFPLAPLLLATRSDPVDELKSRQRMRQALSATRERLEKFERLAEPDMPLRLPERPALR